MNDKRESFGRVTIKIGWHAPSCWQVFDAFPPEGIILSLEEHLRSLFDVTVGCLPD